MVLGKSKKPNVAKTAIARELACFMWGMMTDRAATVKTKPPMAVLRSLDIIISLLRWVIKQM